MRWSEGVYSQALMRELAWKVMFLCVVTQPFGVEVVPLVYIINARRSIGQNGLNGGRMIEDLWECGDNAMNGTAVTSSRSGFSTFSNVGCSIIKDGSESPIVYNNSFTGCDVPTQSISISLPCISQPTQRHTHTPSRPYGPLNNHIIIPIRSKKCNASLLEVSFLREA